MEVLISGEIDADDYVRAELLSIRPRRFFVALGLLVAMSIAGYALYVMTQPGGTELGKQFLSVLAIAPLYFYFRFAVLPRFGWRRQFNQQHGESLRVNLVISRDGLRLLSEPGSPSVSWREIRGWRSDKHLFLFRGPKKRLTFIPRRLLSSAEMEQLEILVREGTGRAA